MTTPDLEKDVYIVCSCERTCRKDGHALSATLLTEGARCSVWISRRHLCTVAQTTLRRIKNEKGETEVVQPAKEIYVPRVDFRDLS